MRGARVRPKIVVLGSMFRLPVPGMVYLFLHYLLGLDRLGFETYYVEWHGNWVADPRLDRPDQVRVDKVLQRFGFEKRWVCWDPEHGPEAAFGPIPAEETPQLYRDSVAILNVTAAHQLTDPMMQCPIRIYLESDPGIPEIRLSQSDPDMEVMMAAHTHHATWGELVGTPECPLPQSRFSYIPTRQPVVMSLWDGLERPGEDITSIARWKKQKDKSIMFGGTRYHWDKKRQFMDYLALPSQVTRTMGLALAEATSEDVELLRSNGWRVEDAMRDYVYLEDYQNFIASSWAEFTIAKDQYVRLRTGWFSDRSACYLATGRPVVTEDTGFSEVLPTGTGLLQFSDRDEALTAIEEIERRPLLHQEAAREIAAAYFDAVVVLPELLEACGIEIPRLPRQPKYEEHPGLARALGRLGIDKGTAQARALGTNRVIRLSDGGSVVIKRTLASRDRSIVRVLRDLLPSKGLGELAPRLHAVLPIHAERPLPSEVWHVFEDLGDHSLASSTSGEAEDLGFLNPLRRPVPRDDLDAVMRAIAGLHRAFADDDDVRLLPPLDFWAAGSTLRRAIQHFRRLLATDKYSPTRSEPLIRHLEESKQLVAMYRDLIDSGPETLLHGDLGPKNIFVAGSHVKLIDWDHAGRGPAGYDLSTLISQLHQDQRPEALDLYMRHNPGAVPENLVDFGILSSAFERARIASVVLSTARAAVLNRTWSEDRLNDCLHWFDGLEPLSGWANR